MSENAVVTERVQVWRKLPGQEEWSPVDPFMATGEEHWTRESAKRWCDESFVMARVPTHITIDDGQGVEENARWRSTSGP